MKKFLKGIGKAVGIAALIGAGIYGEVYGMNKLLSDKESKIPHGVTIKHVTPTLTSITYTEYDDGDCKLRFFSPFRGSLSMDNEGCDEHVERLWTPEAEYLSEYSRTPENEARFKKADKKYSEVLEEYKFKERAAELWKKPRETLEGWLE